MESFELNGRNICIVSKFSSHEKEKNIKINKFHKIHENHEQNFFFASFNSYKLHTDKYHHISDSTLCIQVFIYFC